MGERVLVEIDGGTILECDHERHTHPIATSQGQFRRCDNCGFWIPDSPGWELPPHVFVRWHSTAAGREYLGRKSR